MYPKIKICGMTREDDVQYAAALGVDAIGFVFAQSPRRVEPEAVCRMTRSIPPFISTVGVFVDAQPDEIRRVALACGLDWIQLHGTESPRYCADLRLRVLKAIRVKNSESIHGMEPYRHCVRGFVLDTYVTGQKGGTGKTFDWTLAQEAKKYGPVILAGGLTPDLVQEVGKTFAFPD